jgi:Tol biopolymer transport system component
MLSAKFTKRTLILLLCLLSVLVLTTCVSRSNRFGIIFTLDHGTVGGNDIYRIPDNTQSKVEQLTFTPTIGKYQLLVSKDGDKIIFQTGYVDFTTNETSFKQQHVYLLETNSQKITDITKTLVKYETVPHDFSMDWSPDQKQFVMVNDEGAGYEIRSFLEFVDFDGTNKKDIRIPTTGTIPSLINGVQWSPNGKKFLLTQGVIGVEQQLQNRGDAILIYEIESGKVKQITDYKYFCFPQAWSPTSQQIVATCSYVPPHTEGVSGPETVRIFDVENPGQPNERIGFSPCYDPSWSPDGKQIVFVCDKATDQAGLFIVNSDGGGIREVNLGNQKNYAVLKEPTWSPDGMQIIYVAGSDYEQTNIYSVYPDGSNNRPLTNQEASFNIEAVYPIP